MSINRLLCSWAVPIISDNIGFVGLVHAPKAREGVVTKSYYDETSGEYVVTYIEEFVDDEHESQPTQSTLTATTAHSGSAPKPNVEILDTFEDQENG
jgi:hypothetical protein